MFRILQWSGLVASVILLATFLFSTRRAVTWDSPNLFYGCSLMSGMAGCAWRPDDWKLEDEKYPPEPGFTIAQYGWDKGLNVSWWFDISSSKHWEWILIPLWIPWLIVTLPTIVLWNRVRKMRSYRDGTEEY